MKRPTARELPRSAMQLQRLRSPAAIQTMNEALATPPELRTPVQAQIVELMELARARRARTGNRETDHAHPTPRPPRRTRRPAGRP